MTRVLIVLSLVLASLSPGRVRAAAAVGYWDWFVPSSCIISGWARDPDWSGVITVAVYRGGTSSHPKTFLGNTPANLTRSDGLPGWQFTLPNFQSDIVFAYALGVNGSGVPDGSRVLLPIYTPNVPSRTINCAATSTYQPTTDLFPNPERGWYGWSDLLAGSSDFSWLTSRGITLTRAYMIFDAYRTSPIPSSVLDAMTSGFASLRAAGIKAIPRFTYNFSGTGTDATVAQIQAHLAQLAPILAANVDVIASMEAGFIGAWGEWHTSTNGSDSPTAEAAVLAAVLAALPTSRMVGVRYPADLRRLETQPISSAEAFSGTDHARVGSHFDCFLCSDDDWGTWGLVYDWQTQTWGPDGYTVAQDKAYIAANSLYAVVGGESGNLNPPRSDCPTALVELAAQHYSYLNADYEPNVLASWQSQGCSDTIARSLGYRFELGQAWYPTTISIGTTHAFPFTVTVTNRGYATPFNHRPAYVVFSSGSASYVFALTTDPRFWTPSVLQTISQTLTLPTTMIHGTYTVALWLPDDAATLQADPRYAIRFANLNVWDAVNGWNQLGIVVIN